MEELYRTDKIFDIIRLYLERFLHSKYAPSYEIATFEIDAVHFLRGGGSSLIKHYSYDVLALVAKGEPCLNAEVHEINVLFLKSENETVTVKYADIEPLTKT